MILHYKIIFAVEIYISMTWSCGRGSDLIVVWCESRHTIISSEKSANFMTC